MKYLDTAYGQGQPQLRTFWRRKTKGMKVDMESCFQDKCRRGENEGGGGEGITAEFSEILLGKLP